MTLRSRSQSVPYRRSASRLLIVALAALAACLPACYEEEAIRVYEAPRGDAAPPPAPAPPMMAESTPPGDGPPAPGSGAPTSVTTSLPAADAPEQGEQLAEGEATPQPPAATDVIDSAAGENAAHGLMSTEIDGEAFEVGPIRGRLPGHWSLRPADPPRLASFDVRGDAYTAEVAVTRFPGDVGGELANVNRWRRQIGEPPLSSLDGQESVAFPFGGGAAKLLPIVKPQPNADDPAILVAFIPRATETWFVKMTGPTRMIDPEVGPMVGFLNQLQLPGMGEE